MKQQTNLQCLAPIVNLTHESPAFLRLRATWMVESDMKGELFVIFWKNINLLGWSTYKSRILCI